MRVIGVDSEWDTQDRTRLACVTLCELGEDGRPGPAEIVHGRDPGLAARLLALFARRIHSRVATAAKRAAKRVADPAVQARRAAHQKAR